MNNALILAKDKNWLQNTVFLITLIAVAFGVYINSLHGDFLIDDRPAILEDAKIRNLNDYISKHFKITEIGFFSGLSTAICWHFFGDNPFGYHFFSIIFHIICVILFFFLCEQLFNNKSLSFLSALIFAIHPIHTEAVSWISGRFYLIQAIFYLISFICYVKSQKKSFWFLISLLIMFVGLMLAGGNLITLPIMFISYELLFTNKTSDKNRRLRIFFVSLITAIFVIIGFMYLFSRFNLTLTIYKYRGFSYLIVIAKAFLYYLKILYLPLKRGLFHTFAYSDLTVDKINLMFFASILSLGIIIFCLFKFRNKIKPISFGIMWFLIAFLPFSNIIPICNVVSERYLYLPSIGYSIVVGALFLKIWEVINKNQVYKNILRKTAIVALMLFLWSYSVLTIGHNFQYSNLLYYWQTNLNNFPDGFKACNNLAGTFYQMGDLNNAAAYSYVNLLINPEQPHVWVNLGTIYEEIGNEDEAIKCYNEALDIDKNYSLAQQRLKKILNRENKN